MNDSSNQPKYALHRPNKQLLVCMQDDKFTDLISKQLQYFSYTIKNFDNQTNLIVFLKKLLEQNDGHDKLINSVLLLDTIEIHPDFCNLLATVTEKLKDKFAIIFIAKQDDPYQRLQCAKAGGSAFFCQPIELTALIDKIEQLTLQAEEISPYRILIIEDSKTQATIVKRYLENADMITEVLTNPLEIPETLKEFQPDLILMDLYMPEFSGIEIAKMIRQFDPFVSVPIVFLSAEEDTSKQLNAMHFGGDDFLTKPIQEHHLIKAVITRAKRSRQLRAEMIQDSLTGLLNHTRILEELELEIARSRRTNTALSFVMLDIDHFKKINDSYGHPMGDRIIKGLANLLKQRLRKSDSVGRYGGEEFAIILPQSNKQQAFELIETIRASFAKIVHLSDAQTDSDSKKLSSFQVTFSAGIADLQDAGQSIDSIVQAADIALYKAKAKGRNQIVLFEPKMDKN